MSKTSAQTQRSPWKKFSGEETYPRLERKVPTMTNTRRWRKCLAVSATVLLSVLIVAPLAHADDQPANAKDLVGFGLLQSGRLVRFNVDSPYRLKNIGRIKGLVSPDTALIGIDFRVQDGLLYGVGNGGEVGNGAGVYTIDTQNGQATFVNSLSIPLDGTSFGVDFNPAADRLRIISDTGQNLRHNVNPGGTTPTDATPTDATLTDGTLTYTPPPIDPTIPAPLSPPALGIVAAAYTNNDLDANTATTLFVVDSTMDQVAIQSPANNGILVATGKLGVDIDTIAGFDIFSDLVDGVTVRNRAFATLLMDGTYSFYQINLLTGAATFLGDFTRRIIDIAVWLDQ